MTIYIVTFIGFCFGFWIGKSILIDTIPDASDETIGAGYILSIIVGILWAIVFHKYMTVLH